MYGKDTGPFPGYPENPDSPLHAADFKGRRCVPIAFETDLSIGGFRAHDFYGDGSVYLLDTPGHLPGHMCALVRTQPDSFVFLGGDICHFAGDFRPSDAIPLPAIIPEEAFALGEPNRRRLLPIPCPCSVFTEHHPQKLTPKEAIQSPFYKLSTHHHSSYRQPQLATETMEKMQRNFDADPRVLVCLAHDPALLAHLPSFNKKPDGDLNNWRALGMKAKCHWGWLGELPRHGKQGDLLGPGMREKPIVEGLWRDDVQIHLDIED